MCYLSVPEMAKSISISWPIPNMLIYMDFSTEVSGTTYVNVCRTNHTICTVVIFIVS